MCRHRALSAPLRTLSRRRVSGTMSGVHRHLGFLLLTEAVLCAAAARECFLHPVLSPCPCGFDSPSQCSKNGCSLHVQQVLELCLGTGARQLAPPQNHLALGRNVTRAGEIHRELFSYLFPALHRYTELTGAKPWLISRNS